MLMLSFSKPNMEEDENRLVCFTFWRATWISFIGNVQPLSTCSGICLTSFPKFGPTVPFSHHFSPFFCPNKEAPKVITDSAWRCNVDGSDLKTHRLLGWASTKPIGYGWNQIGRTTKPIPFINHYWRIGLPCMWPTFAGAKGEYLGL